MDNLIKNTFYIDLKSAPFANIAYRVKGIDPHLKKVHSHNGFEIMQIWNNDGYVLIDDQVYPMKEGALYLVNGIESHSTNPTDDRSYTRSKITFSPSFIAKVLEQVEMPFLLGPFSGSNSLFGRFYLLPDEDAKIIDQKFMEIDNEIGAGRHGYTAYIAACLVKILVHIYRCRDYTTPTVHDYPNHIYINKMTEYISQNLQGFSLDRMCSDIPISKYYACHLFKKFTGLTIMEYVLEKRISLAKKMLLTTEKPISEIAMDTGFSSFSLLSRSFKKVTGKSPLNYRKDFIYKG